MRTFATEAIRLSESLAHNLPALEEAAARAKREAVARILDRIREHSGDPHVLACSRASLLLNETEWRAEDLNAIAPVALYAIEVKDTFGRLEEALASFGREAHNGAHADAHHHEAGSDTDHGAGGLADH